MKKKTDFDIIDEIQSVRSENNVNWMDVLRLAFEVDAPRARKLIGKIDQCDTAIGDLIKQLARNGE